MTRIAPRRSRIWAGGVVASFVGDLREFMDEKVQGRDLRSEVRGREKTAWRLNYERAGRF